jgi:hypothetical protein
VILDNSNQGKIILFETLQRQYLYSF